MHPIWQFGLFAGVAAAAIGFAVPADTFGRRILRICLWAFAAALFTINLLIWRATSLDLVQYVSCVFDDQALACEAFKRLDEDNVLVTAPKPPISVSPMPSTNLEAPRSPFPINRAWSGTILQPNEGRIPIRIYRIAQSDQLLTRLGDCIEIMSLIEAKSNQRVYETDTDLSLSGGWGKATYYPCKTRDMVEKLAGKSNLVTLHILSNEQLRYDRISPTERDKGNQINSTTLVPD